MSQINIHDLPSRKVENPVEDGDAIILIKRDGTVQSMTVNPDPEEIERVRHKKPEDMTPEELDLALQGQKLFLLSMAAESEVLMDMLAKVASTPGVIDHDKLRQIVNPH